MEAESRLGEEHGKNGLPNEIGSVTNLLFKDQLSSRKSKKKKEVATYQILMI